MNIRHMMAVLILAACVDRAAGADDVPLPAGIVAYVATAPMGAVDLAMGEFAEGAFPDGHMHGPAGTSIIPLFCGFPQQLVDPERSIQWVACAPTKPGGALVTAYVMPTSKFDALVEGISGNDPWTNSFFRIFSAEGPVLLMRSTSGWPEYMIEMKGEGVVLAPALEDARTVAAALQAWKHTKPAGANPPLVRVRCRGAELAPLLVPAKPSRRRQPDSFEAWSANFAPSVQTVLRLPGRMAIDLGADAACEIQCDMYLTRQGMAVQTTVRREATGRFAEVLARAADKKPAYACAPFFPADTAALVAMPADEGLAAALVDWVTDAWKETRLAAPAPMVIRAATRDFLAIAQDAVYAAVLGVPEGAAHLVLVCETQETGKADAFAREIRPHLGTGGVVSAGTLLVVALGPKGVTVAARVAKQIDEKSLGLGKRMTLPPVGFPRTQLGMGIVFGVDLAALLLQDAMSLPSANGMPPVVLQYFTALTGKRPSSQYPLVVSAGTAEGRLSVQAGMGTGAVGEVTALYEDMMTRTIEFYNTLGQLGSLKLDAPACAGAAGCGTQP